MSSMIGAGLLRASVPRVTSADPGNPWFSWDYVRQNVESLRDALGEHLYLTAVSVLFAALIGLPLSVLAYKVSWLTGPILALSGVLYTIPSLALYAVLGPFLGLSITTAVIGLVLYALLAIVRNTLTGLRQVPEEVRDAGRGMGLAGWQLLTKVELPLALPSILTGLRIATVSTVALVTVTVIVSYGGLGAVILNGFANNFYRAQIMTATLLCVLLALVLDLLLVGIGRLIMPWSRRRRG